MSQTTTINLNATVRVRLTPLGRQRYDEYMGRDASCDEVEEMEFWSLMHIFGPYMRTGSSPMFEDNQIVIPAQPYDWVVRHDPDSP